MEEDVEPMAKLMEISPWLRAPMCQRLQEEAMTLLVVQLAMTLLL
jgi:hypothetical protein